MSAGRHRLGFYIKHYIGRAVKGPDVVKFFRDLLRHLRGQVIVIADRGNIHRAAEVKRYLRSQPRLDLEFLPPYAPDLNPVESAWSNLKYAKLANFCPHNSTELVEGVLEASSSISQSQKLLSGFLDNTPLPLRLTG